MGRWSALRRHRPAPRSGEVAGAGPGGGVGWMQLGSPAKPSPEPGPDPPWPPPGSYQRNPEKGERLSRVARPASPGGQVIKWTKLAAAWGGTGRGGVCPRGPRPGLIPRPSTGPHNSTCPRLLEIKRLTRQLCPSQSDWRFRVLPWAEEHGRGAGGGDQERGAFLPGCCNCHGVGGN